MQRQLSFYIPVIAAGKQYIPNDAYLQIIACEYTELTAVGSSVKLNLITNVNRLFSSVFTKSLTHVDNLMCERIKKPLRGGT